MVYIVGRRSKQTSHAFWWKHLGGVLATLLEQAGYSDNARYRHLNFFAGCIVPRLGPRIRIKDRSNGAVPSASPSFMTDDGTPLELSWDWGSSNNDAPAIRYSVEPIGLPADAAERYEFRQDIIDYVQRTKVGGKEMILFQELCDTYGEVSRQQEEHSYRVFYAFDLKGESAMAKGYICLVPGQCEEGPSILDSIEKTLINGLVCTPDQLAPLRIFKDWMHQDATDVEIPVFSLDLLDWPKSRNKIYYRTRITTFSSVVDCLTLGGRLNSSVPKDGLDSLQRLWDAVLGVDSSCGDPLPEIKNETAGILYNLAFSPNEDIMATKVYIPIRHYAKSDSSALEGLRQFLRDEARTKYLNVFNEAIESLFDTESLDEGCGVQTYLGAQVNPDGSLRVVSYINPQISKLL